MPTEETSLATVTELPGPPDDVRSSMKLAVSVFQHALPALGRWLDEEGSAALQAAVLHSFRVTPALGKCQPESVIAAIHTCGQLGLMPGSAGHIYLIPRGNQCCAQVGYKGWLELARRSGQILSMEAGPLYRCEVEHPAFRFTRSPSVLVVPGILTGDRSDESIVGAYARIRTTSGGELIEVIDRAEIDARRARGSASGSRTPWATDYARMARKSAIHKLMAGGTVPMSSEMQVALQAEAIEHTDFAEAEVVQSAAPTLLGALGLSEASP